MTSTYSSNELDNPRKNSLFSYTVLRALHASWIKKNLIQNTPMKLTKEYNAPTMKLTEKYNAPTIKLELLTGKNDVYYLVNSEEGKEITKEQIEQLLDIATIQQIPVMINRRKKQVKSISKN